MSQSPAQDSNNIVLHVCLSINDSFYLCSSKTSFVSMTCVACMLLDGLKIRRKFWLSYLGSVQDTCLKTLSGLIFSFRLIFATRRNSFLLNSILLSFGQCFWDVIMRKWSMKFPYCKIPTAQGAKKFIPELFCQIINLPFMFPVTWQPVKCH